MENPREINLKEDLDEYGGEHSRIMIIIPKGMK
jgi:hypothetical protein